MLNSIAPIRTSLRITKVLDNEIHTHNGHGLISRLKNKIFSYILLANNRDAVLKKYYGLVCSLLVLTNIYISI